MSFVAVRGFRSTFGTGKPLSFVMMLVLPWGNAMTNKETAPDSSDETIYAIALSEVQTNSVRPGLWAKAFADSEGDENKCKALYIRFRVQHEKDRIQQEQNSAHLAAVEVAQHKLIAFQCVIDNLSSCGYEAKRVTSGWSIREPLGGRIKLKTEQELLDYAQGKISIPAELSSKQGMDNKFVTAEATPFKPHQINGMTSSSFIDPTTANASSPTAAPTNASSEQMTFGKSISTCMGKYVDFNGRATRPEYWWFFLFTVLLTWFADIADPSKVGSTIVSLALLLPSLSVATRRFHDTGRSGWWQLIALTVIGLIPLFIWLASKGNDQSNEYGSPV